jgi:NADH-quinone oxidoreductase subunit G
MSVEEAYLLASFLKGLNRNVKLLMGHVPVVGEDDCYPKNVDGSAPSLEKTKFTIRAEKCPNRMGVEKILKHFQGAVVTVDEAIQGAHGIQSWFFVGGYATPDEASSWVTPSMERAVESSKLLIVLDIFPSTLTARADLVLAGAAFTERDGTFMNHNGLAQSFRAATRPPKACRTDGRILSELCQRQGLFNVEVLRKEIASKVPSLESLIVGDLGLHGVESQQLVGAYS